MIGFMIAVGILSILFWVAFKITGAVFKACVWLFILLPIALVLWAIGIVCCCTILLIPVGRKLFGAGAKVLFP